jgi:hypothetical protein
MNIKCKIVLNIKIFIFFNIHVAMDFNENFIKILIIKKKWIHCELLK